MSDFSDKAFVAGSLTGLRAFRVDPLGRLTGVTHQAIWRPDVNEASCAKPDGRVIASPQGFTVAGVPVMSPYWLLGTDTGGKPQDRKKKGEEGPKAARLHEVGGLKCECGFYAYFDGRNDYLADSASVSYPTQYGAPYGFTFGGTPDYAPRIAGVIEAWGTCTVGTRGFRASRARLLALVFSAEPSTPLAVLAGKVQRNYPDVAIFDSEAHAVAEFPLTDPAPATPEDADFWTRRA